MLLIQNLSFNIARRILFENLNITIFQGAILYIKGPNGSGKTTLMRLIAGITKPQKGNIFLNSVNISDIPKPYCTYIGHSSCFKDELTVLESLNFWSSIYSSYETLAAAIYYFNLESLLNKKFYELSAGNKRKVILSKIIACHSDLWILDETDTNLDKENQDILKNLIITKSNNGGIILISSHDRLVKSDLQLDILDYIPKKTAL